MEQIGIRKAAASDFDFFYLIKCDKDNIYWTGHKLIPARDRLYDFFTAAIRDPDARSKRTIFIAERKEDGGSVGYLYLDPVGSDAAELSIGIQQAFSGRGFGRQAVMQLCKLAWQSGFQSVSAMIREDNARSQRMFSHAGFQRTQAYRYQFIPNLNQEVKMIKYEADKPR